MQAIILAAGMGKRLGHLTQDNTKCMIQVNGVTLKVELWVTRSYRTPLTELLKVFHREETTQSQTCIER